MERAQQILHPPARKFMLKWFIVSTDYVFGGQGSRPWESDCEGVFAAEPIR